MNETLMLFTNELLHVGPTIKGQIFGSTAVKQVKMIQFGWQWSQNVHLINAMKNQNSLPYVRCFVTTESVGMVLDNIEATFQFDPCTNYLVTPRLPVQDVTWQQYEMAVLGPIPT